MKRFLILLFLSFAGPVSGQNWDLFPLNQKSLYQYTYPIIGHYVDAFVMDSVAPSGSGTVMYFNKNLDIQGAGTCYNDTLENLQWNANFFYKIDSLTSQNDSVFFQYYGSTLPFYFLPQSQPGQSWTITSTYSGNNYNQITITCASVQLQTFFGITDSVKTFTMTPNGSSPNQIPVSNFQMRLSKSHGLLEFVPFNLYLYHPNYVDFVSLSMIGLTSNGVAYGYRQPTFHEYFHLSPGDVLFWKHSYVPDNIMTPSWVDYLRDSITQVYISPDSVIYTFDRVRQDTAGVLWYDSGLTDRFIYKDIGQLVEAPTHWVGFGNPQYLDWYWYTPVFPNHVHYWPTSSLKLLIDSTSGDTTTTYRFDTEAYSIDTINCNPTQVLDVVLSFEANTRRGITEHCFYNFAWNCYTLTGSLINGQQTGSISLSVDEIQALQNPVAFFPNPADDFITVRVNDIRGPVLIELTDPAGRLVQSTEHTGNGALVMDVSHLRKGLYFVSVTSANGRYVGRLLVK